jgi:UPF0716 protein FxsA
MGNLPAGTLFDGLLILIAGLLLITPGLLTDLVGFTLLVPPFRISIKNYLRNKAKSMISNKQIYMKNK